MVTLTQINKAINSKIKSALLNTDFSTVPLVAEDVTEPIVRPSIKVTLDGSENGRFNSQCREKALSARVYFFAKDMHKYKTDNLKMQDLLENAFLDDLFVEGAYVPIESTNSAVTDTVLVVSFDINLIELLPEIEKEFMEELIYKEV